MNDIQHAKSLKTKYGNKIAALQKQKDSLDRQIFRLRKNYQDKCRHTKIKEVFTSADHNEYRCELCGKQAEWQIVFDDLRTTAFGRR